MNIKVAAFTVTQRSIIHALAEFKSVYINIKTFFRGVQFGLFSLSGDFTKTTYPKFTNLEMYIMFCDAFIS